MEKITKKELTKIIKEEFFRALKKKELTTKLKSINEEISKLQEVHAGSEMPSDGVHDGQKKAEFKQKGTHLVEKNPLEETHVEEGIDDVTKKFINVKGNDVFFWDQKVGKFDGEKVEIDPEYSQYLNKDLVDATVKAKAATSETDQDVVGMDGMNALGECEDMPEEIESEIESEFETVDSDDDMVGFKAEPIMENSIPKEKNNSENNEWLFEGKSRMLRLGGLLSENEE